MEILIFFTALFVLSYVLFLLFSLFILPRVKHTGIVRSAEKAHKGIQCHEVTILKVEDERGIIWPVGIDGHFDFEVGTKVEFQVLPDVVARSRVNEVRTNKDGSKSPIVRDDLYYKIRRYNIIG
ncbi:hypothetical protein GYA37_02510 [candidate division WWE3 bacterium]|uniref:Uncharacterized protein n=1 Tax=candidate division WWE3 bacterium TaxID=2053526 RepID=A0A7X9E727_UNCKA|nr:hypothetical protein [candidate division WWE3 bacterium]